MQYTSIYVTFKWFRISFVMWCCAILFVESLYRASVAFWAIFDYELAWISDENLVKFFPVHTRTISVLLKIWSKINLIFPVIYNAKWYICIRNLDDLRFIVFIEIEVHWCWILFKGWILIKIVLPSNSWFFTFSAITISFFHRGLPPSQTWVYQEYFKNIGQVWNRLA